jgi:Cys-rich protein (TIGR01571 family)
MADQTDLKQSLQEAQESVAPLSPGFSINLFDESLCAENVGICVVSCCLPCLPLGAAKASLEDRHPFLFDYLCAPNLYQVRQQLRYRYMRPENGNAEDFVFEDFFVALCCTPCGIAQTILEISKKQGKEPVFA